VTDLMTEPPVSFDESCCLMWRKSNRDRTREPCRHAARWEIQCNGEPMALSCSQHLERVLALVYSYEPDQTVLFHVLPIGDLTVHATVPDVVGTLTASLRPVPIGTGLHVRGEVLRDDNPSHRPVPQP
jgi:hypothetical protein